jgi:hypothetical protein
MKKGSNVREIVPGSKNLRRAGPVVKYFWFGPAGDRPGEQVLFWLRAQAPKKTGSPLLIFPEQAAWYSLLSGSIPAPGPETPV